MLVKKKKKRAEIQTTAKEHTIIITHYADQKLSGPSVTSSHSIYNETKAGTPLRLEPENLWYFAC